MKGMSTSDDAKVPVKKSRMLSNCFSREIWVPIGADSIIETGMLRMTSNDFMLINESIRAPK